MLANASTSVTDTSVIANNKKYGICAMIGETERGAINKPTDISSWYEFQREFGGLMSTSNFPLVCKRALDGGAKIKVVKVAHYSNAADLSTLTGVKAAAANNVFLAKNIGVWGDSLTVVVTVSQSNSSKRDVKISLAGYDSFTQTVKGLNAVLTADDIALLNSTAYYIVSGQAIGDTLAAATYTFSGGENTGTVVTADYVGSNITGTGIFALNTAKDIWYAAVPDKTVNAIDLALSLYCDSRKDIRPILRTPTGATKNAIVAYRQALSPYTGTAIDSWRAIGFTGGLKVIHPTTNTEVEISEIGDVVAKIFAKDNNGNSWDSFAGTERGVIENCNGVVVDFASPALESDAAIVIENGINPIINHDVYGATIWGNRSLLSDQSKLLRYAHVGDIVLYLMRKIKPIASKYLFEPNDVDTWKSIYVDIHPILEGLKTGRAIWAYEYQGDQNADSIEDAKVNTKTDIDAGKYKAVIRLYPKSKLEFIDIGINITNSLLSVDVLA